MEVVFLKKFSKDLNKIHQSSEKKAILAVIKQVKSANNIKEIDNLRKLSGFKDAYRIRAGNIRIGVFITKDNVEFARVLHRKDIYKLFP